MKGLRGFLVVKRENTMRRSGTIGKINKNSMMHDQMEGQRLVARTHKTMTFSQRIFMVSVLIPTSFGPVSSDACWPQLISRFGVGHGQ